MIFFWILLATNQLCWQHLVFSVFFSHFYKRTSRLPLNRPISSPDMGLHSCFVSHILCTKDPLFVLASPSYWIGVTEPRLSCCLDCLNLQEKRSLAGRTKKKEKKRINSAAALHWRKFLCTRARLYWNLFSVYPFDRQSFIYSAIHFWNSGNSIWFEETQQNLRKHNYPSFNARKIQQQYVQLQLLSHRVKGTLQMPTLITRSRCCR